MSRPSVECLASFVPDGIMHLAGKRMLVDTSDHFNGVFGGSGFSTAETFRQTSGFSKTQRKFFGGGM